jgi:hypothetical protein
MLLIFMLRAACLMSREIIKVGVTRPNVSQVLLLDVDFLVSHGTAARWASEDAAGALWQSCCARCELFVLPAFQVTKKKNVQYKI